MRCWRSYMSTYWRLRLAWKLRPIGRGANYLLRWVMLILSMCGWQKSLAKRLCSKLSPRYFGPYTVLRKVGPIAYELALPPPSKVHPIFHVSLIRPAKGNILISPPPPLPINVDWEFEVELDKILAHRWELTSGVPFFELLASPSCWRG